MGKTTIEWCDDTLNPIRARNSQTGKVGWFCTKVSPGCKGCYAEKMNGWRGNGLRFAVDQEPFAEMYLDEKTLEIPLHWKKTRRVFICDMTDLFHPLIRDCGIPREFKPRRKSQFRKSDSNDRCVV